MSKENITKEIVKYVSDLIKIFIPDDELVKYKSQLETALEPANDFDELNTSDTAITSQTVGTKNIFREDEPKESLSQEKALMNAKYTENGYVVVKRVVGSE